MNRERCGHCIRLIERDGAAYCSEHRSEFARHGIGCPAYVEFAVAVLTTSTHPEQGRPYPCGGDDE